MNPVLKIDIEKSFGKERTEEETKAALLAFDALQAWQSKLELLSNYCRKRLWEESGCMAITPSKKICHELGIEPMSSEGTLLFAIENCIEYYKLLNSTQNQG